MTSIDSNLLLYAYDEDCPFHEGALAFIISRQDDASMILSEFGLVEFYRLLRNPVVLQRPLRAREAVEVIEIYRSHPSWKVSGYPENSSGQIHKELWRLAGEPGFAYRRIYDARLALTLRHLGVTEFATANLKDFQGFGFRKVWNPLENG